MSNYTLAMIATFMIFMCIISYLLFYIFKCKVTEKALVKRSDELNFLYEKLNAADEELQTQNEVLLNNKLLLEEQQQALLHKQKSIEDYAFYDCLTHLPNRLSLNMDVQKLINTPSQNVIKGALMFIDLDNFKHINDHYGHSFGDQILIDFSIRLIDTISDYGKIYRFGGDEFIILIQETAEYDTLDYIAQKLFTAFSFPIALDNNDFYITFSMGIAVIPIHGDTFDEILGSADMAMYAAKNSGKNKYFYYDEHSKKQSDYYTSLKHNLLSAVQNNLLHLNYQPIYHLKTHFIKFVEATLKWHSPMGIIPAKTLIPLSKELGIMPQLNRFIFSEVCELSNIVNIPGDMTYITFNISTQDILNTLILLDLKLILETKKTDPSSICLEISEKTIINSSDAIITKVYELRELGFKIIIDDFGEEYLSMNYIKKMPIDFVKINIDFFNKHQNNPELIQSMMKNIQNMNIDVIIKNIESETHLSYLNDLYYAFVQGHYYSYPTTKDRIIRMILDEDIKIYQYSSSTKDLNQI